MRILVVCSKNSGKVAPFITEQVDSLSKTGLIIDYFTIQGKGFFGYLKNLDKLNLKISEFNPTVIHAHYGLSGLMANLQRKVPVVTTYHGSDINNAKVYPFSKICILLSAFNIFVSEKNMIRAPQSIKRDLKKVLIPCGVNIDLFKPIDKEAARKKLGLNFEKKLVLFAGAFQNKVKNASLAQQAVASLHDVELLELNGFTRDQVALLMNAVDCVLMTSFTEGSPQFIKEAMACNCPIVSVNVGDVSELIEGVDGCFMSSYDLVDVENKLKQALTFNEKTEGRQQIIDKGLDTETVAKRIVRVYEKVINN